MIFSLRCYSKRTQICLLHNIYVSANPAAKVVKKYPQFTKGKADEEEPEGKNWGKRQKGKGGKEVDGVTKAFLKKNPGLKVD